jgi:hypothetical protein
MTPIVPIHGVACALATALFAAAVASAHPAVSVVRDSAGNVYYSDIARVWRLTPAGEHTVFVPRVHTHELAVDSADRLLGEHLWYDSSQGEPWSHYLWRATPDGRLEKLTPDTRGFRRDHGFALDRRDRPHWVERSAEHGARVLRREADGGVTILARSSALRNVRWFTCSPDGTVYLVNDADLVRVAPDGRIQLLARNLAETDAADPSHTVMGLCADDAGTVHAAVAELGVVKRIAPDGQIAVVARSTPPWRPSGVLAAPAGELWILEYEPGNAMRLRHLRPDGRETVHGP